MKVLFLTLGDETIASSRTRVFQYFPYFKKDDICFKSLIYKRKELTGTKIIFLKAKIIFKAYILSKLLVLSLFYDVVFIQKVPCHEILLKILRLLKRKVIFDFDDAIYTIHQASEKKVDTPTKLKINERFNRIVALSDLVVLENDYAKEYVEKYNPSILMITGPIDTIRYFPAENKKKEDVVIGWIGSPPNTIYLEPLYPVFERLLRERPNVCFKFIGATPVKLSGGKIKQVDWNLETEVRELQEFDIGIMPLPDDEWSRGKGGYKLLQYMAIGIPAIASPVGINSQLIGDDVNGFLVDNEDDWYKKFLILIDDAEKRKMLGANARNIAVEKYSFHVAKTKLLDALNKICVRS